MAEHFEGHDGRECGEHRATGRRAWCFNCQEWCYPDIPCKGCELPSLRAEVDHLRRAVAGWRDSYERLSRQVLRRHHAWQSARRGRAQARDQIKAGREYLGWVEGRRRKAEAEGRRLAEQRDALAHQISAVKQVRTWRNEDGKSFVFADDLRAALDGTEAGT